MVCTDNKNQETKVEISEIEVKTEKSEEKVEEKVVKVEEKSQEQKNDEIDDKDIPLYNCFGYKITKRKLQKYIGCGATTSCIGFVLTMVLLFAVALSKSSGFVFAGANHYYLYTCNENYQRQIFQLMKDYDFKVLRMFLVSTKGQGYTGDPGCYEYEDVENPVGTFHSLTMDKIDRTLALGKEYGIKFMIAMHDRWALGCWRKDAYVDKWSIPFESPPDKCTGVSMNNPNNPAPFYNNEAIKTDFKNRLTYLLNHQNPYLNNKTWAELSDVIFAFEPQNEPQRGSTNPIGDSWLCDMAIHMKKYTKIPIASGGGWESLAFPGSDFVIPSGDPIEKMNKCKELDIIAMHDYNSKYLATLMVVSNMKNAILYDKRVILAEFGSSDPSDLKDHITLAENREIPWFVWSIDMANKDLSFGTANHTAMRDILGPRAKNAKNFKSWQSFPEIF